MKKIALLLTVNLMISFVIRAQQVNDSTIIGNNDSTVLNSANTGNEKVSPIIATDFPAKTTVTYSDGDKSKTEGEPGSDPNKANPYDVKKANVPMRLIFVTGTSVLTVGIQTSSIDISPLGVTAFDGFEIDKPVYSKEEGMVHHILNSNWKGVLKVWETPNVRNGEEYMRHLNIVTTDDSKVIPSTFVSDKDGCVAWATDKGVGVSYKTSFYANFSEWLKLDKLIGTKIEIFNEGEKKKIKINIDNYSGDPPVTYL